MSLATNRATTLLALLLLTACGPAKDDNNGDALRARTVDFSDIDGWRAHDPRPALAAFQRSCAKLAEAPASKPMAPRSQVIDYGTVGDWKRPCTAAAALDTQSITPRDARRLFEAMFVPLEIVNPSREALLGPVMQGHLTGYFEPSYPARKEATDQFSVPALTVPEDLVQLDLSAFSEELPAKTIIGQITDGAVVPYADNGDIKQSNPPGAEPLGYMTPTDLAFLQIQGSGRLEFNDGTVERIGYAGKNGRPYVAIGRTLLDEGHLAREDISMQSIRAWLNDAPPADATRVLDSNPSYVFFRSLESMALDPDLGPLGAQSVQLTAGASIAIDPAYYAYGAPVWLAGAIVPHGPPPPRGIFVAQDTGGAIRGHQRADIFFGSDEAAAAQAGTMNRPGRLVVLVPTQLAAAQNDAPE